MKTLNRTLSLALVFALVFSLMSFAFADTTTTTTTTTGYTDAASITYKEAVDVTSAIGVFQGSNGAFDPKTNLTREQAAKIICYLSMGKAAADKLTTTSAPYTDVAADRWSAGSIAYCQQQGIVSGYGDGKFGPTDTVTGYQFAKMLLGSLGYDATIEQLNGNNWAINTAKLAFKNNLYTGNSAFVGTNAATREEAALYTYNALQAPTYSYQSKGSNIKTSDGTVINVGASAAAAGATFMATYYKSLKLTDGTDALGRPAEVWTYKSNEVGTYASDGDFIYTADKTDAIGAAAIAKDLTGYSVASKDNTVTAYYYENGVKGAALNTTTFAADIAAKTGNGVRVEVFTNTSKQITEVSVVKTDLVKVSAVNTAAKSVTLTSAIVGNGLGGTYTVRDSTNSKAYAALKDLKTGAFVLVTPTKILGTWDIANVETPKTVTGYIAALNNIYKTVYVNTTSYTKAAYVSAAVTALTVDTKNTATVYLDSYGYVIHSTATSSNTAKKTFLVLDSYQNLTNSKIVYMAKGVYADGTTADIAVSMVDTHANTAPTAGTLYTVGDVSSNAYPLTIATLLTTQNGSDRVDAGADTYVDLRDGAAIKATDKALTNANTGTNTTDGYKNYYSSSVKFIYANTTSKTATVKDGVQEVASLPTATYAVITKNSETDDTPVVSAVILVNGVAATASADSLLYIPTSTKAGTMSMMNKSTSTYDTVDVYGSFLKGEALANGAPVSNTNSLNAAGGFYTYGTSDDNGSYVVSKYELATGTTAVKVNHKIDSTFDNRLITIDNVNYGKAQVAYQTAYATYLTANPGDTSGAATAANTAMGTACASGGSAYEAGLQLDVSSAVFSDCRLAKDQTAQPITASAEGVCTAAKTYKDMLISIVYDATTNKASYVYILSRGTGSYGVTAPATALTVNGTAYDVAVDKTSAKAGETVSVTITPPSSKVATGKDVFTLSSTSTAITPNKVAEFDNTTGATTITFTMPEGDVALNLAGVHNYAITSTDLSTSENDLIGTVAATAAGGSTVTVTLTGKATDTKVMQIKSGATVLGEATVAKDATTGTITFTMPSADTTITLDVKA